MIPIIRFPSLTTVVVVALFSEHLLLGGNRADLSLVFAVIQSILLIGVLSTKAGADHFAAVAGELIVPGVLFCLCLATLITPMRTPNHLVDYSYSNTIDGQAQLIEILKLFGLASLFIIGTVFGCDPLKPQRILKSITIAGLVFGFFSITLKIYWINPKDDFAGGRLTGTFISPNTAATLFGLLAILSMMRLLDVWHQHSFRSTSLTQRSELLLRRAPFETAAFVTAMTCLVLSGSRAGLLMFSLSLALLLLLEKRSQSINITVFAGLTALLIAAGGQLLIGRLLDTGSDLSWHTGLLAAHWHAVLMAPIWGYGLGSFPVVNAIVMTPENMRQLVLMGAVHSVYLQWLEQAGLLGALPMFACVAWIIGRTARAAHNGRRAQNAMRGLTVVSVFIMLHSIADYALEVPSIAATWALLMGLGYGMAGRERLVRLGVANE